MPVVAIEQLRPYDPLLSAVASMYMQDPAGFVADKVFPIVNTGQISGRVAQYDRSDWFRDDAKPRAPGKESQGGGFDVGFGNYRCEEWAYHGDIPDGFRDQSLLPMSLDMSTTYWLTQIMRIRRERLWEAHFFVPGIWDTDWLGVPGVPGPGQVRQWDDYVNSDPIGDVGRVVTAFKAATGLRPNVMTCGWPTWEALRNHPLIVARYTHAPGGAPNITAEMVASVLNIERLAVGEAAYTNTPKGAAPVVYQPVLGKHALLSYAPANPSPIAPSAGYIYNYTGGNRAGLDIMVERFRLANDAKADRIVASIEQDMQALETCLGLFIEDVVA